MGRVSSIFSYFAWGFLIILGWESLPINHIHELKNKNKKIVVIFSHTSYWDFWLIILYAMAYPGIMDNVYTVIKPQVFESWYGKILRDNNFIPATKLEEKNGGFVSNTVEKLKTKDIFMLMLSPEGTIKKNEWKSGYYYIAKSLCAKIVVAGFDYEKKSLVVIGPVDISDKTLHSANLYLQQNMSRIIPLNIKNSFVPIYPSPQHNILNISFCDYVSLSIFVTSVFILKNIIFHCPFSLIFHTMIYYTVSFIYHYTKETNILLHHIKNIYQFTHLIHQLMIISPDILLKGSVGQIMAWPLLGLYLYLPYIINFQERKRTSLEIVFYMFTHFLSVSLFIYI